MLAVKHTADTFRNVNCVEEAHDWVRTPARELVKSAVTFAIPPFQASENALGNQEAEHVMDHVSNASEK